MSAKILTDIIRFSQRFLAESFRTFPVIVSLTTLFLGASQGNINYLLFFVGLALVAPLIALGSNVLLEMLFSYMKWNGTIPGAVQCSILSSPLDVGPQFGIPTYWTTITGFFFSYLFWNAYTLYTRPAEKGAKKSAIEARQSQSLVAMVLMPLFLLAFLIIRYATGCETAVGEVFGVLLGSVLGFAWQKFLSACGMGRLDDMFGINNRIIPVSALDPKAPVMCVPS